MITIVIKLKVKLKVKIKDDIKEKTFYRCEWGCMYCHPWH